MTTLREAAAMALEALEDMLGWESLAPQSVQASSKQSLQRLREALAQPEPEPVARECSDHIAECEEGQREKEIEDLQSSLDFYQRRCEALQAWQCKMRDPERTIVCDILANGFTLDPAFAGDRYTSPPQRKPLTDEEIIKIWNDMGNDPIAPSVFSFIACVRKTEQAHGIGGEE